MTTAYYLAAALALVLAWIYTARQSEHLPIASLLGIGIATSIAYAGWTRWVLAPLRVSLGIDAPWSGAAHAAAWAADLISLVWPAAIAGAALVVFARRPAWPAVAGWAGAALLFAHLHPFAGNGSQEHADLVAELVAVLVAGGLAVRWRLGTRNAATPTQAALGALLVAELFALGLVAFTDPTSTARVIYWPAIYIVAFAVLAILQARALGARLRACEARLETVSKGNLRANLRADRAVEVAEQVRRITDQ